MFRGKIPTSRGILFGIISFLLDFSIPPILEDVLNVLYCNPNWLKHTKKMQHNTANPATTLPYENASVRLIFLRQ